MGVHTATIQLLFQLPLNQHHHFCSSVYVHTSHVLFTLGIKKWVVTRHEKRPSKTGQTYKTRWQSVLRPFGRAKWKLVEIYDLEKF